MFNKSFAINFYLLKSYEIDKFIIGKNEKSHSTLKVISSYLTLYISPLLYNSFLLKSIHIEYLLTQFF
jgi:hypothetical protein